MGYYIRILGTSNPNIHIDELKSSLLTDGLTAKFELDQKENPDNWTLINVLNAEGECLTQIERNPVIEGELGKEELEEFREEIKDYKPTSAVKWLDKYFDNVKVIYAFQMLNVAFEENNNPIIHSIRESICRKIGGIIQADNEGFSNEDGNHILWQFSDNVTGDWNMAVMNKTGHWENFCMDLGNEKQREQFWEGKVPNGVKII
jgi:hypothetical protein